MKKILIYCLLAAFLGLGAFLAQRYSKNPTSVAPYPYSFEEEVGQNLSVDAPILIVGDRMGERLASFSKLMASKISENLSKPIKIESMAAKGEGLHRTLRKLKSLKKLPLIIIYLGGTEEASELKFKTKDVPVIQENLAIYRDDKAQTAMMILPALSRLLYTPVDRVKLGPLKQKASSDFGQAETLERAPVEFELYKLAINELFTFAKDRNSYFIAVSTPINLGVPPKRSCEGALPEDFKQKYERAKKLVKEKDYKLAYNITKDLGLIANTSANVHYLHGQVSLHIGKTEEAYQALKLAAVYDCANYRPNPIFNVILKEAAQKHGVAYFDLQKLLRDRMTSNVTFMDDIYPQNLYMEKMASAIALKIKKLLKL